MERKEEWKPVVGFEGLYEVSSLGRVRSLDRTVKNGISTTRLAKGSVLNAGLKTNGYLQVCLGRLKNRYVHRLVAEAFVPNPNNRPEIDHIDGNKQNNNCDNLRWVNRSENNLNPLWREKRGMKVQQINPETNEVVAEYNSQREAAAAIGSKQSKISRAVKLQWITKGYKWIKKSHYDKNKINIQQ